MSIEIIVTPALAALALGCLLTRRKRLDGTTLVAPWRWSILALVALVITDMTITLSQPVETIRVCMGYLSGTLTLCPLMALLGAKRPQSGPWQLIVVTFWIVLILPVGETLLLWQGAAMEIGGVRGWFLLILLLIGLANFILTRFLLATVFVWAGQTLLLLPHLPMGPTTWQWRHLVAIPAITLGVVLGWWQTRSVSATLGWNGVWRDFRDAFGLVWGLRVMERINATAKVCQWKSELTWHGFTHLDEAPDKEWKEIAKTMNTVLRRFVSPEWISQRRSRCESPSADRVE